MKVPPMHPIEAFLRRFHRIMLIQILWGMRIVTALLWFGSLYLLAFGHEYIELGFDTPKPGDGFPLWVVIGTLLGAPVFLWGLFQTEF